VQTDHYQQLNPLFLQTVSVALADLRQQLQRDYEQAYPDLAEIVHLVLDEEESRAWELSPFPHLLLPDLVEAHIAKLNLQPAETRHQELRGPRDFDVVENDLPVFALCG
jgi:hypothetical protein